MLVKGATSRQVRRYNSTRGTLVSGEFLHQVGNENIFHYFTQLGDAKSSHIMIFVRKLQELTNDMKYTA